MNKPIIHYKDNSLLGPPWHSSLCRLYFVTNYESWKRQTKMTRELVKVTCKKCRQILKKQQL